MSERRHPGYVNICGLCKRGLCDEHHVEWLEDRVKKLEAEQDNSGFIPWRLAQDSLDEYAYQVEQLKADRARLVKRVELLENDALDSFLRWAKERDRLREELGRVRKVRGSANFMRVEIENIVDQALERSE